MCMQLDSEAPWTEIELMDRDEIKVRALSEFKIQD